MNDNERMYVEKLEKQNKELEKKAATYGCILFGLILFGAIILFGAFCAESKMYGKGYDAGRQDTLKEYNITVDED